MHTTCVSADGAASGVVCTTVYTTEKHVTISKRA